MKVFCKVQLIVAFLVSSLFVSTCYATLQEETEHKQQEHAQAEVNGQRNSSQVKFGTKIATKFRQTGEQLNLHMNESGNQTLEKITRPARNRSTTSHRSRHNATNSVLSSPPTFNQNVNMTGKVSRRHDAQRQSVKQHEIPKARKTQNDSSLITSSTDSAVNTHKRAQNKPHSHQRSKSKAEQVAQLSQAQSQGHQALRKDVNSINANEINGTLQLRATTTSGFVAATISNRTSTTTLPPPSTNRPFFPNNFQISNPFDFIPQIFGNLSRAVSPATTSSKKPPKKYKPITSTTSNPNNSEQYEAIQNNYRPQPETQLPKTTTKQSIETPQHHQSSDGPFRIALPTLNFFNQPPVTTSETKPNFEKEKGKRATVQTLRERYNCPRESEVRFQLFPKICKTDKDCSIWNRDELCCDIFGASSCVSGLPKPLEETSHMPIFGVIPRKCPTRPLAELWWDVQECESDNDCWPRVCCPDGRHRYCRTSQPELETVPVPVKRSFNYLTEYLECTAPPPPIFDLHPKACTSTFDCFPNVCCQEAGLRHCRPPKKSVLTLMANFLNVDFVKRLTQNIVIK